MDIILNNCKLDHLNEFLNTPPMGTAADPVKSIFVCKYHLCNFFKGVFF